MIYLQPLDVEIKTKGTVSEDLFADDEGPILPTASEFFQIGLRELRQLVEANEADLADFDLGKYI